MNMPVEQILKGRKPMGKVNLKKDNPVRTQSLRKDPEWIAQFRQTRENCLMAYRKVVLDNPWMSRRMLKVRGKDFRPVYVPFAVYGVRVDGDTELSGKMHTEDAEYDYYNTFVTKTKLKFSYEKILISRTGSIPSWILRIKPEDLKHYYGKKKISADILPVDTSAESAADRARTLAARNARSITVQALEEKRRFTHYRLPDPDQFKELTTVISTEEALLPAWIMSHGKKKKTSTIINGFTGDVLAAPFLNIPRLLLTFGYFAPFAVGLLFLLFKWINTGISPWIPALAIGLPLTFLAVLFHGGKCLLHMEPDGIPIRPKHREVKILSNTVKRSWKSSKDDD